MEWLSSLSNAIFGDPSNAGLQTRVTTYEDLHADVQGIVIPDVASRGLTLHALQPLNRNFALFHRMFLETTYGQGSAGGAAPDHRIYALGGVLTGVTDSRTKFRLSSQLDTRRVSKTTALIDVFGDGSARLQAQAVDNPADSFSDWGVTGTLRGADYAAAARVKSGPAAGVSYHQRLCPGSPLTLGGEFFTSLPAIRAIASAPSSSIDPKGRKPIEWAMGMAYDTPVHKTGAHFDVVDGRGLTLSLHHLYRVTERAHLAAKFIHDTQTKASMMAAGYRLKFRNTMSTVTGMFDSYGNARCVVEREPLKDVRFTFSAECNFWPPPAAEREQDKMMMAFTGRSRPRPDKFRIGLMMQIGAPPPIGRPMSPCLLTKDIFGAR